MFDEELRYIYPLREDAVVMDVGAHKLTFALNIIDRHPCKVLAFEPVSVFRSEWPERHERIDYFPFGIGGNDCRKTFRIKGDMTGEFSDSETVEEVEIRSMRRVLSDLELSEVDLLKINIEGGEFDLLEHIIREEKVNVFDDIQIQFHGVVKDFESRRMEIQKALLKTHQLTYSYPWCWENYERIRVR